MRQIILDTETTGLHITHGHKIIEIGAIEMINRRMTGNNVHHYINPKREIDEAAIKVHGITLDQLQDKPIFADLGQEIFDFLKGSELIIHNAPFDIGFLNYEFKEAGVKGGLIDEYCEILDTLVMARHKHPGQKNNLDALCKRYKVSNKRRALHGALLDAEILADVYLAMTYGQMTLLGEYNDLIQQGEKREVYVDQATEHIETPVIIANDEELIGHQKWLKLLEKESGMAVWRQLEEEITPY